MAGLYARVASWRRRGGTILAHCQDAGYGAGMAWHGPPGRQLLSPAWERTVFIINYDEWGEH